MDLGSSVSWIPDHFRIMAQVQLSHTVRSLTLSVRSSEHSSEPGVICPKLWALSGVWSYLSGALGTARSLVLPDAGPCPGLWALYLRRAQGSIWSYGPYLELWALFGAMGPIWSYRPIWSSGPCSELRYILSLSWALDCIQTWTMSGVDIFGSWIWSGSGPCPEIWVLSGDLGFVWCYPWISLPRPHDQLGIKIATNEVIMITINLHALLYECVDLCWPLLSVDCVTHCLVNRSFMWHATLTCATDAGRVRYCIVLQSVPSSLRRSDNTAN